MEITLTLTEFLQSFPVFATTDANLILQTIDQVLIETEGYNGLPREAVSKLAVKYHVAHILELTNRSSQPPAQGGLGVKSLKTKHDQIVFNTPNPEDIFDFGSTLYGKRLEKLLEQNTIGFTWGRDDFCGNSRHGGFYY